MSERELLIANVDENRRAAGMLNPLRHKNNKNRAFAKVRFKKITSSKMVPKAIFTVHF